jgi:hypothetical protein
MLGFGLRLPFLVTLIAIAAAIEWFRLRHTGPRLVLRQFRISRDKSHGEILYILGRRAGLIAYVLSLFGLHPQTSFSVSTNEVVRETVGPSGFESIYAPLSAISASRCQSYRAFFFLVLSFGIFLYGLLSLLSAAFTSNDYVRQQALDEASTTAWLCAVVGSLLYLWYALSKRVLISVRVEDGLDVGISFKRSVIENASVDLLQAIEAADILNSEILLRRSESNRIEQIHA